jgi:hypothetical protein
MSLLMTKGRFLPVFLWLLVLLVNKYFKWMDTVFRGGPI